MPRFFLIILMMNSVLLISKKGVRTIPCDSRKQSSSRL